MKRIIQAGVLGAACWICGAAHALQIPVNFAITNTVVNEFGEVLPGTSVHAPAFGQPYVEGAIVQILNVSAGVFPPSTNGAPHPSNTVLMTTRIGVGVNPNDPITGKSSGPIGTIQRDNPALTNQQILVRVFNKPTLEDSSFYGNSQLFTVPVFGQSYDSFLANVQPTTNELDTTDHDNDGLSRSWEKSHGTNPDNEDSDNDGMIDGHEIRAGTKPLDNTSLLIVVQLLPQSGNDLLLSWDTVAGKTYQLQVMEALTNNATYADILGPVAATSAVSFATVTNGLLNPESLYRVRLVE